MEELMNGVLPHAGRASEFLSPEKTTVRERRKREKLYKNFSFMTPVQNQKGEYFRRDIITSTSPKTSQQDYSFGNLALALHESGVPFLEEGFPRILGSQDTSNLPSKLNPDQICFIDTETTGLAGGTGTIPFMIGIGWWEKASGKGWKFIVRQYLIGDFGDEEAMLLDLEKDLSRFKFFCTYNGRSFDIPLLKTRAVLHRIRPSLFNLPNLDLLYFTRRMWSKCLDSCRLGSIEEHVLGIERGPDIDSALIPELFFQLARTGECPLMERILNHNAQDLVSLGSLLYTLTDIAVNLYDSSYIQSSSEYVAVARWLEKEKDDERSQHAWQQALQQLPQNEKFEASLSLSRVHKKRKQWDKAVEIWKQYSVGQKKENYYCAEELAKYFEHVEKNYEEALSIVHQTRKSIELRLELNSYTSVSEDIETELILASCEKRTDRLNRRIKKRKQQTKRD